ncbi:Hypothetical predicted protein [Olea europaea subsp. europaea]|uniref:Uncharacterized protein n=1 Tax=Olea europaea subsp. europaea TaxID=158383 RepID=A0A8S0R1F1_OLEEU|nr:Hypothetical predicted protein [Olea europaea subsp. europaea]
MDGAQCEKAMSLRVSLSWNCTEFPSRVFDQITSAFSQQFDLVLGRLWLYERKLGSYFGESTEEEISRLAAVLPLNLGHFGQAHLSPEKQPLTLNRSLQLCNKAIHTIMSPLPSSLFDGTSLRVSSLSISL